MTPVNTFIIRIFAHKIVISGLIDRARNQLITYAMMRAGFAICSTVLLFLIACQKKDSTLSEASSVASLNDATLPSTLSYGDSIFYTALTGTSKVIFPLSKPADSGFFASNLPGIELDSASGRINVSRSETGLRYKVYYVSLLSYQPIDSTSITISGIDYKDGVYDISSSDTTAFPIYNMVTEASIPENSEFDETDLNNDNIEDIPGANRNKLMVNTHDGTINLKESFLKGVFGP